MFSETLVSGEQYSTKLCFSQNTALDVAMLSDPSQLTSWILPLIIFMQLSSWLFGSLLNHLFPVHSDDRPKTVVKSFSDSVNPSQTPLFSWQFVSRLLTKKSYSLDFERIIKSHPVPRAWHWLRAAAWLNVSLQLLRNVFTFKWWIDTFFKWTYDKFTISKVVSCGLSKCTIVSNHNHDHLRSIQRLRWRLIRFKWLQ